MKKISISIIIPVYNAEAWIEPTINHIVAALKKSKFHAEIIVVDDGSSDASAKNAKASNVPSTIPFQVLSQPNEGRYLARKRGVEASKYENILFVDSRVYVDEGSLAFLHDQLDGDPDQIWNGHVNIDKKGNLFARFWDAIVCIAWRRYFRRPTTTSFGLEEFDYYPKGTGFFYVPKPRLLAAMEYFEETTSDLRFSSDDTLLIRHMITQQKIHLSPQFSCLYHGRSTFTGFLKHAYNRGQFFVHGFLRPGTRYYISLLSVLFLSLAMVVAFILAPLVMAKIMIGLCILFILGLFLGAILFGIIIADSWALAVLGLPFGVVYLLGLWRGVLRLLIHSNRDE